MYAKMANVIKNVTLNGDIGMEETVVLVHLAGKAMGIVILGATLKSMIMMEETARASLIWIVRKKEIMAFVKKNATLKLFGVMEETVLLVGWQMVMVNVILIATQKSLIMMEETVLWGSLSSVNTSNINTGISVVSTIF